MEELNKTQVVLLTLFITFVTSVTTGIVTVTLLQQAPPAITQTINRVVEHTIQTVTPAPKTEVTKVIIGQEDQIIKTAALAKPSIVRIVLPVDSSAVSAATSSNMAALASIDPSKFNEVATGFLVSADGLVATSLDKIPDETINYNVFVGDKMYNALLVVSDKNDGLALLKIDHDKNTKFVVPQFLADPLMLGQTIIVLGRDLARYTVSVGLVSSIRDTSASASPSFKTTVKIDDTNIGGPLFTSDGLVAGMNLEGGNSLPIDLIRSHLTGNSSTTKTSV